ncbi:hypothetical protein BDW66DRAFT_151227 [Aspergillus desertorum]
MAPFNKNALFANFDSGDEASPQSRKRETGESDFSSASKVKLSLSFAQQGSAADHAASALSVLEHLQQFMEKESNNDTSILLGCTNGTVAGMYLGPAFGRGTVSCVLERLEKQIREDGVGESSLVQLCGEKRNAHHVLSVAVDTTGNVAAMQKLLSGWSKAECAADLDETDTWDDISGSEVDDSLRRSSRSDDEKRDLLPRADCEYEKVVQGDMCDTLAARCGITTPELIEYSGNPNLCLPGCLIAGQRVCCNRGILPDIRPKPNKDGSCVLYTVQTGDDCSMIAVTNGLSNTVLERYNNKTTWGWNGCGALNAGITSRSIV